jgi:hypothetical protein
MKRKPVIGVMGGSKASPEVCETARRLGALIAKRGWVLLNGGRDAGVMAASAAGAKEAGGLVIGILPDTTTTRAAPDLDVVIVTGMGDARNVINVMSADVVIACSGALGTLSEIVLALKHDKHVILLGFHAGPEIGRLARRGRLVHASSPEEAVEQAAAVLGKSGT